MKHQQLRFNQSLKNTTHNSSNVYNILDIFLLVELIALIYTNYM